MVGEPVTIINRTSRPLSVRFDGRTKILPPGPSIVTSEWVRFAKLQNPRMGSFTAGTLDGEYLVGVEGVDDCDMIDESGPQSVERFDRVHDVQQTAVVLTGERDPKRMLVGEFSGPVPANAGFDQGRR